MKRHASTSNDNVTQIVRTLLAYHGQQQADLAGLFGWDSGTVSRALNGKRYWTIDDLAAMAKFFEVSVSLFFEDAGTLIANVRPRPDGPDDSNGGGAAPRTTTDRYFPANNVTFLPLIAA